MVLAASNIVRFSALRALSFLFAGASLAMAQTAPPPDQIAFYESSVQPVLRANCAACHSGKVLTSGFSLDTRESMLRGGNRGPAVVPGDPEKSLLLTALRHSGDVKMPPGRKLSEEQIAIVDRWVKMGAPMKESATKPAGSNHWAFQQPKRPEPPQVANAVWARNPIDRFVLQKLEQKKLAPSPAAPRELLLRRVYLDLVGLLPTPAQLDAFLKDQRSDAYERVVDELLASEHYGERWGRHWLDIARYADSDGYTIDAPRDIWKYRDWVINATNKDVPFDTFVIEQLAGDMLPNPTNDQLTATGFHRNTPSNFEGGIDFEQYRVEAVADRVATTGAAFLGLTLGCARCHDHKYDPISQREFYQFFAFLNNADEVDKEADRKFFNKPFLEMGTAEEKAAHEEWQQKLVKMEEKLQDYLEGLTSDPAKDKEDPEKDPGTIAMRKEIAALRKDRPKIVRTMIMRELPTPRQSYIHLGGDFTRKGVNVQPGVPAVLPPLVSPDTPLNRPPNRVDLARWIVDKRNPLTARVTVNRMWQQYFGKGIVETESDFGLQGDKPTHPELLDWLAVEFMDRGWSRKAIHRLIVTSATYQQSSDARQDAAAVDPDNRLLARQARLRLDAEIVRDASLVASGLFAANVGGPSVYPPLPPGANNTTQVKRDWPTATGEDRYRRGMYTFFQRSAPHPGLMLFDAPDASVTCTRRVRSNTPLQALTLLNDEAYIEFAEALGKNVMAADANDNGRIEAAYKLAMNRKPSSEETERMLRFVRAQRDSNRPTGEQGVWTGVARVLLNLDEFMTRE
jgi:mono/diheme cytochrome c family protein